MVKEFSFSYGVTVFFAKGGFFHDEIEIPERVTILVIRLSGCLYTSRIIADSVKNSTEFLSQKWGFYGFCLNSYFPIFLRDITLLFCNFPTILYHDAFIVIRNLLTI